MNRYITLVLFTVFMVVGGPASALDRYYPPERILCKIDNQGKIACNEINRNFLIEDATNADFGQNREIIFHFVSATAYFDSDKACLIRYMYMNADSKLVKLRTVNTSIIPDLKHGNWVRFNEDIYTCDAGYMSCPITNRRNFS